MMSRKEVTERIDCLRKTITGAFERGSIDFDELDAELVAIRDALENWQPDREPLPSPLTLKADPGSIKRAINSSEFK
jgi:hypothetical protein